MDSLYIKEQLRSLPEIDADRGLRHCVGNIKNYRQALYIVLKSCKFKIPLMESMLDSGEYEGLGILLNTLGQLLGNIGADNLVKQAQYLEICILNIHSGAIRNALEAEEALTSYIYTLTDFVYRLEDALRAIDSYLSKNQPAPVQNLSSLERTMERKMRAV